MFHLKPIEREAIPRALTKAERYRLLNEPREAESICRDILAVEPGNNDALVCLILALSDLFEGEQVRFGEVRPLVEQLASQYERHYYAGVIHERWAKALLKSGHSSASAYAFICGAMHQFDAAQATAPRANEDAVLRRNACVRLVERYKLAAPDGHANPDDVFSDDVPVR